APNLRENLPLYTAIADAIEKDVLAGRLRPGDQLPTHRELTKRLRVTVGTVSRAYAEARKAGWLSGEVGRGTFVLDRGAGQFPTRKISSETEDLVDLGLNVPVNEPSPNLAAAMRALSADISIQELLRYSLSDSSRDRVAGATVLR